VPRPAAVALGLYVAYLLLAFVVRSVLMARRTGTTGFRGVSGRPGSAEWLGGVLFVVALVLGVAAPVADLLGVIDPIEALDGGLGHGAGIALAAGGIVTTLLAQRAMGSSWRIGVDAQERTALVTDGPFAVVRNPVFAAMIPTGFGLALIVPNAIAVAGFIVLVIALELQTRVVEEPYLRRLHGDAYAGYAARVGRFMPGVGRLPRD
jgi:protein-S-isoprenylcysteine O-methyltransferase Ste14